MVIVTVNSKTKPEYTGQYLDEFKKVAIEVRAEHGCLEYELYQCADDRTGFFLFERWKSKEDLDAHLKTTHMVGFLAKTADWFESKDIKVYTIQ